MLHLINELIDDNGEERSVWDESAIRQRTQNLVEFAMEEWKDLEA